MIFEIILKTPSSRGLASFSNEVPLCFLGYWNNFLRILNGILFKDTFWRMFFGGLILNVKCSEMIMKILEVYEL